VQRVPLKISFHKVCLISPVLLSLSRRRRRKGVFDETSKEDGIYVNGIRMIVILSLFYYHCSTPVLSFKREHHTNCSCHWKYRARATYTPQCALLLLLRPLSPKGSYHRHYFLPYIPQNSFAIRKEKTRCSLNEYYYHLLLVLKEMSSSNLQFIFTMRFIYLYEVIIVQAFV